ncbi:MAG: AraC family transcriptional regulator, partial [Pseudomonas sp.]
RGGPARISRCPQAYRHFCQLNTLLFSAAAPLHKEAALVQFMAEHDFAAYAPSPTAPAPSLSGAALVDVIAGIDQAELAELSLASLAAQAGLGRYQLIRAFQAATGLTPHAYLLNARVNRARQCLRQGLPLADVAYKLGFADQSHFQRVFKAHAGTTPGRYRLLR